MSSPQPPHGQQPPPGGPHEQGQPHSPQGQQPYPPQGQQPPPGGPHEQGQPHSPQGQQPYPPQGQPHSPQGQPQSPQGQQPYPSQGQPYLSQGQQPYPSQGQQPYPPQGQPHPPPGQPYPSPGQPYPSQGQQPYPQTPPHGQPYGQPSPPGQPSYGQPPYGQPPFPGGAPQPPRKSNGKVIRAVVVIVGILVAGGVGIYLFTKSPASANVGDCIKVEKASSTDAEVEKIGCDSPEAVYRVGKKLDSDTGTCPDGDYIQYTQSSRGSDFSLCLTVNAAKGECLTGLDSPETTRKVACGGGDVEVEIVEVLDGKTDVAECAAVEGAVNGLRYTEPPSVVCVKIP